MYGRKDLTEEISITDNHNIQHQKHNRRVENKSNWSNPQKWRTVFADYRDTRYRAQYIKSSPPYLTTR